MQGMQIQSLVGELKLHMLCGQKNPKMSSSVISLENLYSKLLSHPLSGLISVQTYTII